MGCATRAATLNPGAGQPEARPRSEGDPAELTPLQGTRSLIRRGRVDLVVGHIGEAAERIDSLVRSLGGEPEAMHLTDRQLTMVLRVPGDRLDAAVLALGAIGRVESSSVSTVDVTDRMADMDARLTNLRAVRDRLRQYLDRAGTIPDVLSVERELVRVQSEIDSLEARLAIISGQVAMSELSVRAREEVRLGPLGLLLAGVGNLLQRLFVLP